MSSHESYAEQFSSPALCEWRPPTQRGPQNLVTPLINLPTFPLTAVRFIIYVRQIVGNSMCARFYLPWSALSGAVALQRESGGRTFPTTVNELQTALPSRTSQTTSRLTLVFPELLEKNPPQNPARKKDFCLCHLPTISRCCSSQLI